VTIPNILHTEVIFYTSPLNSLAGAALIFVHISTGHTPFLTQAFIFDNRQCFKRLKESDAKSNNEERENKGTKGVLC